MELTDEDIFDVVATGVYLILAYTDWCPMCRAVMEILSKLEEERSDFIYAKFNFQECPEAIEHFNVLGVPTVLCVKDGVVQDLKSGFHDDYDKMLASL